MSAAAVSTPAVARQGHGPEPLAEVEMLCLEIATELREVVEMLTTYREIIGQAARAVARAAVSPDGEEAAELARELARMANIEGEIEQLLPSSEAR